MFINLTNHPSEKWSEEQLKAARHYGEIIDISFPLIDENAKESEINRLADDYFSTILSKGDVEDLTVHIIPVGKKSKIFPRQSIFLVSPK